jgi:hypothetical protein
MMVDVSHAPEGDEMAVMRVRHRSLVSDAKPDSTQFEKVPESEIRKVGKPYSRTQILERAHALVGKPFTYRGFESNCESFAYGVVTGRAYSTQKDRISRFSTAVSEIITETALSIKFVNGKAGLSRYTADPDRMSAKQMMAYLEQQRKGERRDSAELVTPPLLPDPTEYAEMTEDLVKSMGSGADVIRAEMYKRYFLAMFALGAEQNAFAKQDAVDSKRKRKQTLRRI